MCVITPPLLGGPGNDKKTRQGRRDERCHKAAHAATSIGLFIQATGV
jgi:hypothetical protein